MQIKFCPNCGNKVSPNAKFCGKCGQAFEQPSNAQAPQAKTGMPQENAAPKSRPAKENSQQKLSDLKNAAKDNQLTEKVRSSIEELNQQPEKKAKMLKIAGAVLAVAVLLFGWSWVSTKDYRQAMANGDSYFSQGEYSQAIDFYQKAHDEKPGDKKAMEMRTYAKDLSSYWIQINADEYTDSSLEIVKQLESKAEKIKDKEIKAKYTEAAETIRKTDRFELEKRIDERYTKANDL
ncbi:zinc ribbon domain-containing protein [Enterococcus hirae]|nr:zinc ribbon domain-containing protein [Enterococcus hirae]